MKNIVAYPGIIAGTGAAISLESSSAAGTTEDYNLVWPDRRGTSTVLDSAYSWAGMDYSSQATFSTASGQGKHDLLADPELQADSPYSEVDGTPTATGQLGVQLTTSVFGQISLEGTYTNIAPEPTSAISHVITWGDGTSSDVNPVPVNVTTSHTYAKPGAYTITDTLTAVATPSLVKSWSFMTTAVTASSLFADAHAANGAWSGRGWVSPAGSAGITDAAITGMPNGSSQVIGLSAN